jgi:4'-phosphopantetheinyl transferase
MAFPPPNLTLLKGHVHIWRSSLDLSTGLLRHLAGKLSVDEQQRANKFYFERDKNNFIACRGLLRIILSRYLNLEPNQLQFSYGIYGKPELGDTFSQQGLYFNLSHSQSLAVYAIALHRSVGIDLEYLRPMPDVQELAERFFSPSESAIIKALPKEEQQEVFFRIWTIKEAYLKATGEGLAGLQKVAVSFTEENTINLQNTESNTSLNNRWFCTELKLAPEYKGALVVEGKNVVVSAIDFSADDIIVQ